MIYLLHGFGGSAEESRTIQTLIEYLSERTDLEIRPINYSSMNPSQAYTDIANNIDKEDNEMIFIGVSLGGFWARYFANQYPNSKLIMINPALYAHELFTLYGGKTFNGIEIPNNLGKQLIPYFINKDDNNLAISVVVSIDDIVVPPMPTLKTYADRADILVTEGGHRLELFDNHLQFINNAINNIAG